MRMIIGLTVLTLCFVNAVVCHAHDGVAFGVGDLKLEASHLLLGNNLQLKLNPKLGTLTNSTLRTAAAPSIDSNAKLTMEKTNAERKRKRRLWTVGKVFTYSSLPVLAGSIVTGAIALKKNARLKETCQEGYCVATQKDTIDSRDALALTTDILIAVGSTLLVTGVIILIAMGKKDKGKKHKRRSSRANQQGLAVPDSERDY